MLKNIVINRIQEIRKLKDQPKLRDIFIWQRENKKSKDFMIKKLYELFGKKQPQLEDDPKFD